MSTFKKRAVNNNNGKLQITVIKYVDLNCLAIYIFPSACCCVNDAKIIIIIIGVFYLQIASSPKTWGSKLTCPEKQSKGIAVKS